MLITDYVKILKKEFSGYNGKKFGKDVLAGITVAAVALPLALAFGVSSGATAASGLVTAIISGLIIGVLSGASYQISGPTGAMTAILVSLVAQYGMQGVFMASLMAGILLLLCGIFKLGGLVSYLPSPVITGFTSGIAIIIALGQIDNLTGMKSSGLTNLAKIASYFTTPQTVNYTSLIIGLCVIVFMFIYPKKLGQYCPGSLAAIIIATAVNLICKFDVNTVGAIPKTIFLDDRLSLSEFDMGNVGALIIPAVSIAALGLIESLLCGASAGRMKNEKLNADVELVAQGIGNILLPFFGGVPSTAAIARTSVAIKSGGETRLTSVVHAVVLLLSMFVLGDVMSNIPLSALAGVLIVTAWRMNEWSTIKSIFGKKLKTAIFQFLITMAATVVFDLTKAILIGVVFSLIMFVVKVSDMQVTVADVDPDKLDMDNVDPEKLKYTSVVYITGPLYFGTCSKLEDKVSSLGDSYNIIFSMRGVTVADISGIEALHEYCERLISQGRMVYFSCVQPPVMDLFERTGLKEDRFKHNMFFWSTDKVFEHISNL
ncbi:MAG: SulP family inorganic anion transporter [Oscillospiraceae bacterium]|nr:SulP family inorganic anion transporter [Oscillospiraceae bacterium]MDY6207249.1 SulP family inorganic anion transporter [Oscillospiraceae bacterium]